MSERREAPPGAVVDTNLLVSGLITKAGTAHELIEALRRGAFIPVVSELLLDEYSRVLSRPKLAQRYGLVPEEVADLLLLVQSSARWAIPRRRLPVAVRDKKDEGVLATALGGKADYLVTGDEDLLVLGEHPKLARLRIVTARGFLEALGREECSCGASGDV